MSLYTQDAADALADIAEAGGVVTFPGAIPGTAPTYTEATDTWSGGTAPTDAAGSALKLDSDPNQYRALSLVLTNPITLLIAGYGLLVTPRPGMPMGFGGATYTIKNVDDLNPAGDQSILWTVIGDAG